MTRSKTGKDVIRKSVNADKALSLRLRGRTYRQIADEIGVSVGMAHKYIEDQLDQAVKRASEKADDLLAIELDRLDNLTSGVYDRAIKGDDDGAILSMLRIMQQRSRLLGLDAPTKTEAKVEQSFDDREEMKIILSDPKASAALDAFNDAVRQAKERAGAQ